MTGVVHLVGAGPGDPGLLTVRARELLDEADVVVHDRLVSAAVLALVPATTLRVDVGKAPGGPSTTQREIIELLVRLARAGRTVVRLKGGDPFVFGRGAEECLALRAAGVPFTVVPGVTAGTAGPLSAGIPITHRGLARSVAFVAGHDTGGRPIDWSVVARMDTVVVYMAGRAAARVAAQLIEGGRAPSTPVALIAAATLPGQEVWQADLRSVARGGFDGHPGPARPAMLVVGSTVALSAELGSLDGAADVADRPAG
jgi:uroporphyrin-III C-methyltransferase